MPVKPVIKQPGLPDFILFRSQKARVKKCVISASYDDKLIAWRKQRVDMYELRRQLTSNIKTAGSGNLGGMEATADYGLLSISGEYAPLSPHLVR